MNDDGVAGGLSWLELIAGCIGAIIPVALRANLSPRQVLVMLFVGVSLAVFGGPAAFDYLSMTNPHFRALLTLAIGMGSMSICEAIMKWLDNNAYSTVVRLARFIPILRGYDRRKRDVRTSKKRRATDPRRRRR